MDMGFDDMARMSVSEELADHGERKQGNHSVASSKTLNIVN